MDLNSYYKEVYNSLTFKRVKKKRFISDLKESIENYRELHPTASLDDVQLKFGSPEQIATSLIADADEVCISEQLKVGTWIKRFLICSILLIFLATMLFYSIELFDSFNARRGHYSEEIIENAEE